MPEELCGQPENGPVEPKAFTNCAGFLADVPDVGPVELIAFINCADFANPDPALYEVVMVSLGPCTCCQACCPIDITQIPTTLYFFLNGELITLTRTSISPHYVANGFGGEEGRYTVEVIIEAGCVALISIVDTLNCYDVNSQATIVCFTPSLIRFEYHSEVSGGGCDPSPTPIDVIVCTADPCPEPAECPCTEYGFGGGMAMVAGASAASSSPAAVQIPCEHLGDRLTGIERVSLGLSHLKDWRWCAKGYGNQGAVCDCLPTPLGCKGCPGYEPAKEVD